MAQDRGPKIFKNPSSHLKILRVKKRWRPKNISAPPDHIQSPGRTGAPYLCTPALGSDTGSQTPKTDVIVKVFFPTSKKRPSQSKYIAPSI